jgi:cytochrome b pre-mRNA-processing protein 3
MAFPALFRKSSESGPAASLYDTVVAQSRHPAFFQNLGVPDTVDGRFDMIAMHAFLLLRRLKSPATEAGNLPQVFFDTMFGDMDRSLREMGAGDLGVGRRVKGMATSFYGRIAAYERGLADPTDALEQALARNLYGTVEGDTAQIHAMADYMRREARALDRQSGADLLAGRVVFGEPPED